MHEHHPVALTMSYTVIFPTGKVMTFYVKGVAELYASLHKGTLVTPEVLDTPTDGKVISESA